MKLKRSLIRCWALLAVLALVVAACGPGDEEAATGSVALLHGITGDEEQAALNQMIDAYEEATGNTVEVEVSPDFETVIVTRATAGDPPDVAFYPQPGLAQRVVDLGEMVTLADAGVDVSALESDLVPGMLETGSFDGETYGAVVKLGMKSLLWYTQGALADAGYDVPDTWDELLAVTDGLAADLADPGRAPWCIGIESGGATGWVATDWIEDIMLRMHGPEPYDAWVAGDLAFDSPEVRAAFEELERIWFDEDAVFGGTTGILGTPFIEAVTPMFADPPNCMLHRQAGFIAGEFPEGHDIGMAYLPPMDDAVGSPVLFAGDLVGIHTADNPVAADFVEFILSPEGQEAWMGHAGAGSLAVRADFDSSAYPSEELAQQGEFLAGADFARFDASDMMPGEVGAGAFWTEMVAWISGGQDLDTTLQNIDAAWPS